MYQNNNNSTAIAKRQQTAMSHQQQGGFGELREMGQVFAESGFFSDSRGEAQAVVKIMAGRELGLPPIVAMTSIHIVKGRVSVSAQAMGAIIKRTGQYDYRVAEHTTKKCVIEFFKDSASIGKSEFTMEDAQAAGLAQQDTWKKYPRNLLFARALSNGARWHCPHLILGVYTHEEMGARVDSEGEIIEAPRTETTITTPIPTPIQVPRQTPMPKPFDVRKTMAAIHATAHDFGISHEDLHGIFQVESLKDLDEKSLTEIPQLLKQWAAEECAEQAEFEEDIRCAGSLGELREYWEKWYPQIKQWNLLLHYRAEQTKNAAKDALIQASIPTASPEEADVVEG